jgi:DNA invertase Pin-like site-specific DNA recombinase
MSAVLAYLRVSTEEQGESGAGLAAQRRAILAEADRRGWTDIEWHEDIGSGKDRRREELQRALAALKSGEASILCVSKMDRLSRSLLDFTTIMAEAQKQGWALVALDCPSDMTTPAGEAMASVLTVFSQLERRLIGERTRNALAERRAEGVQLGRRRSELVPDQVRQRIATEAASRSYAAIARTLNDEGIPTAHGGARWHAQTVRRMALSEASS